jgi:hypothetical protein
VGEAFEIEILRASSSDALRMTRRCWAAGDSDADGKSLGPEGPSYRMRCLAWCVRLRLRLCGPRARQRGREV